MNRASFVAAALLFIIGVSTAGDAQDAGAAERARLATACEAGDPSNCYFLGESYAKGTDGPIDPAKANAAYTKSCDLSKHVRLGCYKAGRFVTARQKVICDSGVSQETGILLANECLSHAEEREREAYAAKTTDPLAQVYFEKSCQQGSHNGCSAAANRVLARDPIKARALFTKGCANGESVSCYRLADMQAKGEGGAISAAAAKSNYSKACDIAGTIRLGCDQAGRAPTAVDIAAKNAEEDAARRKKLISTNLVCTGIAKKANVEIESSNAARIAIKRRFDADSRSFTGDRFTRDGLVRDAMTLNNYTDRTCVSLERTILQMQVAGCPDAQIEDFRSIARDFYNERKASQYGGNFDCKIGN